MQDELVFSAAWNGRPMTAHDVINLMKDFLVGLARISPWEPPFDVSGSTMKVAHMIIKEDLSDFDEVVLKAMDDKEVRFFSKTEPETMRIRQDSQTIFGVGAVFSDYPIKRLKKNTVRIEFHIGSSDNSIASGVSINVPFYKPFIEKNGIWAMEEELEQPQAIFNYLLEFFDPYLCSIYSLSFLSEITEWGIDINSPIGWMSYSRNPKVINVLKTNKLAQPYGRGYLLKLGENVHVFDDPESKAEAIKIRDELRDQSATDWLDGAKDNPPFVQ